MTEENFVVLDLETTGLTPKTDRILEIGAVKVLGGEIAGQYETFVNPRMKIPKQITELTGISDEMVADAPDGSAAVTELLEFCGDLPLLGHNILFDYSFVKHIAVNGGFVFEKHGIDTLQIARKALPDLESRSLEFLCGYYQIPRENAHRAMDDVLETLELYRRLKRDYAGEHPEWFEAKELIYQVKRQMPCTEAQKRYLRDLTRYHGIAFTVEIDSLTKSEASRYIDQIILNYGRIARGSRKKE